MGWSTRLRNGIASVISADHSAQKQIGVVNSPKQQTSFPLNALHRQMNMPNLEETIPGLSQPVWGPEIATVGAYSREGYTSKTRKTPTVPFRIQAEALEQDEDVQLAINQLSSLVTGGEHYISTSQEYLTDYFEKFSKDLDFDIFDTELVKELLWYGNSFWKPRLGIANVRSYDDLMHIPISSAQAIWWDRQRQPYKYEFRGAEYQGYHNVGEVIHFTWNKVDASVFSTGFGTSVTSTRTFDMAINGEQFVTLDLPSMLARKYATQFNMQMAEQRYISTNVWQAPGASETERAALQSQIETKTVGQDVVAGSELKVEELGSNSRNFNSEQFTEITQAPIFKALNNFKGKQAGESQHTYANAETAAALDEIGLAAFPIAIKTQLAEKLFRPWYEANPYASYNYLGGLIPVPWDEINFDLNFGQVEKKDIAVEDMIKLIEIYMQSPMIKDPKVIHNLFKQAGLDIGEYDDMDQIYNDPNGQMAMQQAGIIAPELPPNSDMGGGEIHPVFNNQIMGSPPMDNPIYDSMATDPRGENAIPHPDDIPFVPSNYHQSNQSQDWGWGRDYE